jgi:hypothetical protein
VNIYVEIGVIFINELEISLDFNNRTCAPVYRVSKLKTLIHCH